MTYTEIVVDSSIDLFFFGFGLASGVFLYWLDDYKRRGN